MAPRDTSASHAGHGDAGKKITSLKLEFSKAADYGRVDHVFDPAVKKAFDPHDFVLKRAEPAFRDAVNNGRAVFLSDQDNEVKSLVMAYHYEEAAGRPRYPGPHPYTEIGTTISMVPGYRSAMLMVSIIALKEWLNEPAHKVMAAEIEDNNGYSLRAYRDTLKWDLVKNQKLVTDLYDAHDDSMANPADRGKGHLAPEDAHHHWYEYRNKHVALMAQIVLEYMKQGGLTNKHNDLIPVDFSALNGVGLTEKRLKAMSGGNVHRPSLWQMK